MERVEERKPKPTTKNSNAKKMWKKMFFRNKKVVPHM
jgi:hypothetical protein